MAAFDTAPGPLLDSARRIAYLKSIIMCTYKLREV